MGDFKIMRKNIGKGFPFYFSFLILLGSYGEVKFARDLITNNKVALKIYEKFRLHNRKRR